MDISVIICAHNPEQPVFTHCLDAINAWPQIARLKYEVILVDNNSKPALAASAYIAAFLQGSPDRSLIVEPRLGQAYARLAGLNASKAGIIVFIDDDNLPAPDYLLSAQKLIHAYPHVGVWGPGVVEVHWQAGCPNWATQFASLFQQKRSRLREYGSVVRWTPSFPSGTGMVVRREVLERYASKFCDGRFNDIGRSGNLLGGVDDAQIVWTSVHLGLCAGLAPELRMGHLIGKNKANLRYMTRLAFGAMASWEPALIEAFPEELECLRKRIPTVLRIIAQLLFLVLTDLAAFRVRKSFIDAARFCGERYGWFRAAEIDPPFLLRFAAAIFH